MVAVLLGKILEYLRLTIVLVKAALCNQSLEINIHNMIRNRIKIGGQKTALYRDERLDSVKYYLIILVIAGHVFSQSQFSESQACTIIWKWIYMFHMPLFVFISGRFSYKKDKENFLKSIWKLLEPLIVFQFIICLLDFVLTGSVSLKKILTPWWVLWYLLSLTYWRLLIQLLPSKILNKAGAVLIVTFCISLSAGFLPFDWFLSVQRTLSFMPFFFLGYYMKEKSLFISDCYRPLSLVFLSLTILVPLFIPSILGDLNQAQPYNGTVGLLSRMFVWFISFPMSLAFLNLCPNTTWASKQGHLSMQYYIYHAFIIYFLMIIVRRMGDIPLFTTAALITSAIVVGLGIASRLPYFCAFTNPSALLKK